MDLLNAATHDDPYPYYARLRSAGGLVFHPEAGLWVASTAQAVEAVLAHPACRVRPAAEPVPRAIADGAAGRVFGQLMRMNEGERHRCPRAAVEPGLQMFSGDEVEALAAQVFSQFETAPCAVKLFRCQFELPVSVVAALLGFPEQERAAIARLTYDFVACLSPLSRPECLSLAHRAAEELAGRFERRLADPASYTPLLAGTVSRFERSGQGADVLIANLIGLLSQTCEASAGLIGNGLIALLRQPQLRHCPSGIEEFMAEVERFEPPVQNTRRFVAEPCVIDDVALNPGDAVLVLLASANRDDSVNEQANSFRLDRQIRRSFSFGEGRHRCPGRQLAMQIAGCAVKRLAQQSGLFVKPPAWHYRPSLNGRIALFNPSL